MQGTVQEEPLANGAIASVPRHPLWMRALQLSTQRQHQDPGIYILQQKGPGLLHAAATVGTPRTGRVGGVFVGASACGTLGAAVHCISLRCSAVRCSV